MPLNKKLFKVLYRLTLPGGLLLALTAFLVKVGILADPQSAPVRLYPLAIFAVGLGLSAFFLRSRLFFAALVLTISGAMLCWVAPFSSPHAAAVMRDAIAVLLPVNLVVLAFVKERGIISRVGRRRLAILAGQIIVVAFLCLPFMTNVTGYMQRPFIPVQMTSWSRMIQPALIAFLSAACILIVLLIKRYRAVESSLLWALIPSFIAMRLAQEGVAGVYLAAGGLAVIVAVIENSYSMAYLDELTQLPSRRALNEALMKLPDTYTVAMFDVDHFKKFNDTFGHESGDQALQMVASRLARIAGGGKAYRYGGEEFTIVFPGKAMDEVFVYLERMRKLIEQSVFTVRGKDRRGGRGIRRGAKRQTRVTVSVGVASTSGDQFTPAEVMRIADQALYKAKGRGRNCVVTARNSKAPRQVESGLQILSVS
ncbi:MAG TPA: GGDEF domain-containing protein [Candidatus Limnocylindrales bacterium]|nr:GGDEF domain-containing protein [Candidatus Limnocylindrales bacterium]